MLRRRTAAPLTAAFLVALLEARASHAFCRTTTCETCVQPTGGCVNEGHPLYWPITCVTYDVQQDGSKAASYDTAREIADLAFV